MRTYDDWLSTEPPDELGECGERLCPVCGGDAAERDDLDGSVHVCRRCRGRGWLQPRRWWRTDDDD
jgi:hypothetical protein